MIKYVYTDDQMKGIATFINSLNVTGIEACKQIAKVCDIIDNPVDKIEEQEEEKKC